MYLTKNSIEEKLQLSQVAFIQWRSISLVERAEFVRALSKVINKNKKTLAEMVSSAMGKLPEEALREAERCEKVCEQMPALAKKYLVDENVSTDHQKSYICYQPLGILLGITPWNFPLWQVIRFAIPNILAGNTVLVKHAPNVFVCAEALEKIFLEAGFPKGVFQNFPIDESDVEFVIKDTRVQGVSLTGSVRAGRSVAKIAGENLKKVVLELGGSDPFIVLEDADIDLAVKNACQARFMNSGQICVAAKRILVHEKIANAFTNKLLKAVSTYSLAPLARKNLCDALDRQVQESVAQGARVLCGGKRSDKNDCAYEATILDQVQSSMPVFQQETFGPVSCITRFSTDEEAIYLANDSSYGLGASIWTRDKKRGELMALKIEAGMVYVNSLLRSDIALPFGGIKNSGIGRELGEAGFREFTNIKTIVVN